MVSRRMTESVGAIGKSYFTLRFEEFTSLYLARCKEIEGDEAWPQKNNKHINEKYQQKLRTIKKN